MTIREFYAPVDEQRAIDYYNKFRIEDSLGHSREAMIYIDSCIKSDPGFGEGYLQRGRLWLERGVAKAAQRDLYIADSLGCSESLYLIRSWMRFTTLDTIGMAKDIEFTMKYFPNEAISYVIRGFYKGATGDPTVMKDFDRAAQLSDLPYFRLLRIFVAREISGDYNPEVLLKECKQLVRQTDGDTVMMIQSRLLLANLYGDLYQTDSAFYTIDQAYLLNPEDPELNLKMAAFKAQQLEADFSTKVYQILLDSAAQDENALQDPESFFEISETEDLYRPVYGYLQKAEANSGDNNELLMEIANQWVGFEEVDSAIRVLGIALLNDPSMPLYLFRASLYQSKNDPVNYQRDMDAATDLFFKDFRRNILMGYYVDNEKVVQVYDSLTAAEPNNIEWYRLRGELKFRIKDYAGAIEDFSRVIQLDPANSNAYKQRGIARFQQGFKSAACEDLRKASALGDPTAGTIVTESCRDY